MQTRAMGPAAGWSWLTQAVNLGRHNPKALFGAAALMMLVALVPSAIQFACQAVFGTSNLKATLAIVALTTLAGMLIFPLLIGGFYRVIDATENNRQTHATALFDTFRAGNGRGRLIGLGLLLMLIYILALGIVIATFGSGVAAWYWQLLTATQNATPGTPPAIPTLPDGIGTVLGLSLLVMMFVGSAYAIAFGQVSLTDRSVGGALADGFSGALKNLLPLVVLTLISLVLMMVVALLIGIVVAVLFMLGGLVHPMLGIALAAPVYLAILVVLYVVMFGVMYFMWRDVCGPTASTPANHFAA